MKTFCFFPKKNKKKLNRTEGNTRSQWFRRPWTLRIKDVHLFYNEVKTFYRHFIMVKPLGLNSYIFFQFVHYFHRIWRHWKLGRNFNEKKSYSLNFSRCVAIQTGANFSGISFEIFFHRMPSSIYSWSKEGCNRGHGSLK